MPQALNLGIDYHTFWELNPRRLKPFVIAYEQRTKQDMEIEQERMNTEAWLIGVYVQQAICASLSKSCKYPQKPIAITADAVKNEKYIAAKARMETFMVNFNQKFAKKEVE